MTAFYRDVLGLKVLAERDGGRILFFRLGDGFAGHTAVLALFAETEGDVVAGDGAPSRSSLHHLVLSLPAVEQAAAQA